MNEILLNRIATYQILNINYNTNLGLFAGKTGCSLFFYHYARYTDNSLYSGFADDLLEDVFEDMRKGVTMDFYDGLCGIGFGLQYLISNHFVVADPDILDELDLEIMKINPSEIKDYSLRFGLEGMAWYLLSRLSYSSQNKLDSTYLNDFLKICTLIRSEPSSEGISLFVDYYSKNEKRPDIFFPVLYKIAFQRLGPEEVLSWQCGLRKLIL